MITADAFLRDICENPGDDAPRLVFADWLDDNGQPRRAEFIRLQCRLATLDECDPQRPDLLDREWDLLVVYRSRWRPAAPSVLADHLWESAFLRGFFAREPARGGPARTRQGARAVSRPSPHGGCRCSAFCKTSSSFSLTPKSRHRRGDPHSRVWRFSGDTDGRPGFPSG